MARYCLRSFVGKHRLLERYPGKMPYSLDTYDIEVWDSYHNGRSHPVCSLDKEWVVPHILELLDLREFVIVFPDELELSMQITRVVLGAGC